MKTTPVPDSYLVITPHSGVANLFLADEFDPSDGKIHLLMKVDWSHNQDGPSYLSILAAENWLRQEGFAEEESLITLTEYHQIKPLLDEIKFT